MSLHNIRHDKTGRWTKKTNWHAVTLVVIFTIIFGAYIGHVNAKGTGASDNAYSNSDTRHQDLTKSAENNCVEIVENFFECASENDLGKWKIYQDEQIKRLEAELPIKIVAVRTKYSRADSCHNPDGNKCLTAIGKDTVEGRTVACPRNIKLGTHIRIEGKEYVCEDRYSTYLDDKRGMPTFDVFAEAENLENLPSYKTVEVAILK